MTATTGRPSRRRPQRPHANRHRRR
ncbi:MAG: hypothetical protein QOJ86_3341, partial [Bradyrhizobium sp.]|nr:hypothetical protein [Bradyrhizobium sp.]